MKNEIMQNAVDIRIVKMMDISSINSNLLIALDAEVL